LKINKRAKREKKEEDKMSKPTKEEKGYGYEEKDA
jgi:hypothetical protein